MGVRRFRVQTYVYKTGTVDSRYFDLAYLEAIIWSMLKHENLTIGNKILWERGEIAPKEQFLLFSTILSIYLYFRSQITYTFVKCGCSIHFS